MRLSAFSHFEVVGIDAKLVDDAEDIFLQVVE